ncbi:molybdopterin dinucleotide binding domain-containing protein, partial [Methylomagnum sp.]
PANIPDEEYPLVLNTGRIRDQWHTMTRTGKTPRLTRHLPEPYAELHPRDAIRFGIEDGTLVRLVSRHGEALARARVSEEQRPGSVFMPMHWTAGNAPKGWVNALVNPVVDPISGEPESKHTPVRVEAYRPAWHGFLLAREPVAVDAADYRVSVRGEGYWLYELAGESAPENWGGWARDVLQDGEAAGEWLEFADPHAGRYRCAVLREGRLNACLFASAGPELPPRDWLGGLFAHESLPDAARTSLLVGRPASPMEDKGRIVCSCYGVGVRTLVSAIRQRNLTTPEEIGRALHAGTKCGSCVPELKGLLRQIYGE